MMPHKLLALICLCVVVLLGLQAGATVRAQSVSPPQLTHVSLAPNMIPPGLVSAQGNVGIMVELADPPALAAMPAKPMPAIVRARAQHNAAAQAALAPQLGALGARTIYSTQLVYNGIAVEVPVGRIADLRQITGVRDVHLLTPKQILSASSVPFVQAPRVWGGAQSGATGAGVRIGIIDSGIDYTHADFGGSGNAATYSANNPTVVEPGSFPTAKVIGGTDLAGDAYDPVTSPFPAPDADPLDCNGHGTAVASAAAGYGVTTDGHTYTGAYTNAVDFSTFSVSPGVAPQAQIYALKVLGCSGDTGASFAATSLIALAIERAIAPDPDYDPSRRAVDVLLIPLGTPFGSPDDPDAQAAAMASAAGVTVVASAGNSADTFYSVSSPASATAAIAVAATYDADDGIAPPDVVVPFSSRGPQRGNRSTKPDIAAPGYNIVSAAKGTGAGISTTSGTSLAAAHVAGATALLQQLHPSWTPQQIKAALMNTAFPIQNNAGAAYTPTYGGMGRLNVAGAATTTLLAYEVDNAGGVGIDFGPHWVTDTWKGYRSLKIENLGDQVRKIAIDSTSVAAQSGVKVRPATVKVTLQPHSSRTVRVWSTINANKLTAAPDPTVASSQDGPSRFYIAEQAGAFTIVDNTAARIRTANGSAEQAVDTYLDDTLVANGLQIGSTSAYVTRPAGTYTLSYYRTPGSSSSSVSSGSPSLSASTQATRGTWLGSRVLRIGAGSDDTMLLRTEAGAANNVEALTINENAVQGAAEVGRVRFVNNNTASATVAATSSANNALDVFLDGRRVGTTSLANLANTGFLAVLPGQHSAAFFAPGSTPDTGTPVSSFTFSIAGGQVVSIVTTPLMVSQIAFGILSDPRPTIRVPFALIPEAASSAHADVDAVQVPAGSTRITATIQNNGARNDPLIAAKRPLGGAFELTYSTTQVLSSTDVIDAARLRYLGITSNYNLLGQNIASAQVYFAIAAQADWSTPNDVEFEVFIDSDLDGVADHVLVNTSLGSLQSGSVSIHGKLQTGLPNDVFASVLYTLQRAPDGSVTFVKSDDGFLNVFPPAWPSQATNALDLAPFNRRVLFMRASAAGMGLGLSGEPLHFRYQVVTRHRDDQDFGEVVDQTPWLDYDLGTAAIDASNLDPAFSFTPIYNDTNNAKLSIGINPEPFAAQDDVQLLLLHFHNQPDQQTEVISLQKTP